MVDIKNVWMLTFESKPIVKVGGLGEVPPNLASSLVKKGVNTYIIMPSHAPEGARGEEKITSFKLDGTEISVGKRIWKGVTFILFSGGVFNDERVYSEETMMDKVVLLAKSLGWILQNHEKIGIKFPDVIHFHDWHSVVSLLKVKHTCSNIQRRPELVYHIHLLIKKRIDVTLLEKAGVPRDFRHEIRYEKREITVNVEKALEMARNIAERLGALESDIFVTVSRTYLREDKDGVLNSLGWDLEEKGGVIYNGTDWRYSQIYSEVVKIHKEGLVKFIGEKERYERDELRKYFLQRALGNMPKGEPRQLDPRLFEKIKEKFTLPFLNDGRVESFDSDGPLAITTGRLSRQKGIDLIVEAIPKVLKELGSAKFVFLVLPVWGGEEYADMLIDLSRRYPYNVRVVFGIAPSIYRLAHISSDAFIAPSRWEPFGIMALEAMVTGNPVIASAVGGLKEIVLDIREYGFKGTGLHVNPGDSYDLADAIRDMLAFMEGSRTGDIDRYAPKIGCEKLRNMLEEVLDAGDIVRKSAIDRVETHFTWDSAAEMALAVYKRGIEFRTS